MRYHVILKREVDVTNSMPKEIRRAGCTATANFVSFRKWNKARRYRSRHASNSICIERVVMDDGKRVVQNRWWA